MNEETVKKWIAKAENDLKSAEDELLTENPATDAICFHAQQCAEKYLKAYLIYNGIELRKTHDIAELMSMCIDIDAEFSQLNRSDIVSLTYYAVKIKIKAFNGSIDKDEFEEKIKELRKQLNI